MRPSTKSDYTYIHCTYIKYSNSERKIKDKIYNNNNNNNNKRKKRLKVICSGVLIINTLNKFCLCALQLLNFYYYFERHNFINSKIVKLFF